MTHTHNDNTEHAAIGKVYDAVNITKSDITDHYTMLTILKQVHYYTASQVIRKFIYTPTYI
jgi:hypothetical protein